MISISSTAEFAGFAGVRIQPGDGNAGPIFASRAHKLSKQQADAHYL